MAIEEREKEEKREAEKEKKAEDSSSKKTGKENTARVDEATNDSAKHNSNAKKPKQTSSKAKGRCDVDNEDRELAPEISRVRAAGKGKESMTPLSAELRAEVEQQHKAVVEQNTDEG